MASFPVILFNSFSAVMVCVVIAITWKRRSDTGALQLIIVSVFMLIWAVGSFTEMMVSSDEAKILWRDITQIGVFYTPPACLLFAMAYTGFFSPYRRSLSYALFSVQTMSILLILTDRWHHLMRTGIEVVRHHLYATVVVHTTVLSKIMISLNFVYMAVSFLFLVYFAFRTTKKMRRQVLFIIGGMGIAILYAFVKVASGERLGMIMPISGVFAISSLSMLLGITKYDLFMIAPIARDAIFNIVDDGIIVTSADGGIVDVNKAALRIFCRDAQVRANREETLGLIESIIEDQYPRWHDAMVHCRTEKYSVSWDASGATEYYHCDVYAITNKRDRTIGSVSVVKDTTGQKKKNDLLKSRAERDGLTGIYNRQTFVEYVERLLRRYDREVCFLFFDVDHFKDVNDLYGHICGDYVLKEICRCIKHKMDGESLFGRIGGEEFAILTKEAGQDRALEFAEKLRASIEAHDFVFQDQHIRITISIGMAMGRQMSFDELYHVADLNLYRAKDAGKNCVRY